MIVPCIKAVTFHLPVLCHDNHRRLECRKRGEDKIHQDERIGIKSLILKENHIEDYPAKKYNPEGNDKFPASSEAGNRIGSTLAEGQLLTEYGMPRVFGGIIIYSLTTDYPGMSSRLVHLITSVWYSK